MMTRFVADLTWPEVESFIHGDAVAVLPVGASAKEHGRHLPMMSDFLQAEFLAARLAERENVLVWPTVGYGFYPAFTDFPGSCTLESTTFERVIEEVAQSIFLSGVRVLLILNTGISTIAPLDAISARSSRPVGLAHVYRGTRYAATERKVCAQQRGGHGDEAETSIMLAIAPDRVRMNFAKPWESATMRHGKFVRADASHPNYSPDGICGNPTLATREKGQKLVGAMLDDVVETLRLLRTSPTTGKSGCAKPP